MRLLTMEDRSDAVVGTAAFAGFLYGLAVMSLFTGHWIIAIIIGFLGFGASRAFDEIYTSLKGSITLLQSMAQGDKEYTDDYDDGRPDTKH